MKAKDHLSTGEGAIAIFTRDDNFFLNPDGTGRSGWWKINPDRLPDRVVFYNRPPGSEIADVILANVTGYGPSVDEGRIWVYFSQARNVGSTRLNWIEFAEGGQNPIRYLSG